MKRIYPIGPGWGHFELENFVTVGDGIVDVVLKAEDVGAIQTVGPVSSDHRARRQNKPTRNDKWGTFN
jgi:hypothetical protein